jgi:ribosomal protein L19
VKKTRYFDISWSRTLAIASLLGGGLLLAGCGTSHSAYSVSTAQQHQATTGAQPKAAPRTSAPRTTTGSSATSQDRLARQIAREKARANTLLGQYGGAYQATYRRAGGGTTGASAAVSQVAGFVTRDLPAIKGDEARRSYANQLLRWTTDMEKANPKLKAQLDDLRKRIVGAFGEAGTKVKVVNDTIVEGSKKTWKQFEGIISRHAERGEKNVSNSFQIILNKANAALRLMGFSPGQAALLIAAARGGPSSGAAWAVGRGTTSV